MASQKLGDFLKSHLPLIVILAAIAAFVAVSLISNRDAADEPTPASGAPPSPAPSSTNAAEEASASAGWGPAYSGGEIRLSGGWKLQLPSDVYVVVRIDNVYCGPFVDNAVATPCPPTPLYTLKRGDSVVLIDGDGNIDEAAGDSFRPSDFTAEPFAGLFAIDENDVWDPSAFPFLHVSRRDD